MVEALFAVAVAHFVLANVISVALLGSSTVAVRRRWHRNRRAEVPAVRSSPLTLPLSAVVPAFNEQDGVVDCVHAILQSGVPDLEVIVVDDGSTDDTVARLASAFDLASTDTPHSKSLPSTAVDELLRSRSHPNVWLIRKQNGGKADSVNAGINLARFRYVLMTDADSIFEPGALLAAMTTIGFDAAAHVGVGGMIRVRNGMAVDQGRLRHRRLPATLLETFQVIEYMGAMSGSRAGWNGLNAVPVLSGAFSIWRRDVLLELGGMTGETTHEDIEFTFRVHEHFRRVRRPYLITSQADSIVWTEAPHRWMDLYRQRKRWQRVVYECLWRYRRMVGNPRYGEVGTIAMPYMLVFEALGPFMEVLALVLVALLYFRGVLSPPHLALFLIFSTALVALTRIVAISVDATLYHRFPPRAVMRLSAISLLELFVYRPVILLARLMAFPEFVSGRTTWERMRRETKE